MPSEQPFGAERLVVVPCGVQHHVDAALDVTVRGLEAADIQAEAARDRGTHVAGIQLFALDFAAFDDIFGQREKDGLLLKREPKRFHVANQTALLMAHGGQRFRQLLTVPSELGPVGSLANRSARSARVNVGVFANKRGVARAGDKAGCGAAIAEGCPKVS